MQKNWFEKNRITYVVIIIGIIIRLVLFNASPPNNSFDDHMEVINLYANSSEKPYPSQCWECYQPPIYYCLGALILKAAPFINPSPQLAWKAIQLINPLLSIFVLIIFLKLLKRNNISKNKIAVYMSFIAVLPIDILTASMIGNDYLVVFSAISSLYFFIKTIDNRITKTNISISNFCLLCVSVLIGSLSKQHGLILLTFPAAIIAYLFTKKIKKHSIKLILIFTVFLILSLGNEYFKFKQTGIFLVSNQHFYNYANGQYPGSLEKVEFTTFRIYSLFQNPFMSNQTSASFPTELFARSFFDYEWRFLSPKINAANDMGRIAYTAGILWVIFFLGTSFSTIYQFKNRNRKIEINKLIFLKCTPLIVGILFFAVPIIQTIRYPYYSSMKATFALSGIIILIFCHAIFTKNTKLSNKISLSIILFNIIFGIVLINSITTNLPFSINHLSGPLWPMP